MSDVPHEPRRIELAGCCGFSYLFRAFRLAIHPTKLFLAFCCVFGTYLTGRILDRVWPESGQPVIIRSAAGTESELRVFANPDGGGRTVTKEWLDSAKRHKDSAHAGVFKLLMDHGRTTANQGVSAVLHVDIPGVIRAGRSAAAALFWLMALHPVYGIIFLFTSLLIWSYFGGALCRVAAMQAARDERIGVRQALAFARGKFASFVAAPLLPLIAIVFGGFLLWAAGLVLAIPVLGDILSAVILPLAILGGAALAFIFIGAGAGAGMMFPTIAAEGSDAFDSISRSFSYTYLRPWRLAWYALVSLAYGAVCFVFIKFFVRLAFWLVHTFMGWSMNWGSAYGHGASGTTSLPDKLDVFWTGPSLLGETAFWGGFAGHDLAHVSWFAQLWFYLWIFTVYGCVTAFLISFCYSAWTLIYFLLRREVDATDLEDVYLEEEPQPAPVSASSTPAGGSGPKSGDTSLPVIGSS
jgi:hypothetical protein